MARSDSQARRQGGERTPRAVGTGLAALTLTGPDAATFLDAQSMTALATLAEDRIAACAFADARGRVLMIATAWRRGADEWWLTVPAGELEWFAGHLQRFRFRARVAIAAATGTLVAGVPAPLGDTGLQPASPGHVVFAGDLAILGLAADRQLLVGSPAAVHTSLSVAHRFPSQLEAARWKHARLLAGEVRIQEQTRGRFLPQMLDLDRLGAISLRKGCYPGQEVIARTQHLGRVKRRMVLLHAESVSDPGTTLELDGTRVEVLDHTSDDGERRLLQVVAPDPLPDALCRRLVKA